MRIGIVALENYVHAINMYRNMQEIKGSLKHSLRLEADIHSVLDELEKEVAMCYKKLDESGGSE